jgi:aryl-alcohol dehydrogenase-like predicted oxidoreductase
MSTQTLVQSEQVAQNTQSGIVLGFLKYSYVDISDDKIIEIANAALERTTGFVYFDTAAVYGNERDNEKIAGRIAEKMQNNRIKIITKFGIAFDEKDPFHLSDAEINESFDASTVALGRVPDVFMSHRIPKFTSDDELMRIANTLGQLRIKCPGLSFGMSEPSLDQLKIVLEHVPIKFIEISYGPFDYRSIELVEFAKSKNITVLAYGVCLRGTLNAAKKLYDDIIVCDTPEVLITALKNNGVSDFALNVGFFQPKNILYNWNEIKSYLHACDNNGPNTIAVAWCYFSGVIPIIETSSVEHLKNNLANVGTLPIFNRVFELRGSPNPVALEYLDN